MSPFDVLELSHDSTPADVEARWRVLRSELHPDKGGDAAKFDEAKKAYEAALYEASQPKLCDNCGGAGKVSVQRGFNQTTVVCPVCHGSRVK